jgi:hypothetical protein
MKEFGKRKQGFRHDYALSIALCAMFLVSWLAQGMFQWAVELHDAQAHGEAMKLVDFIAAFGASTFENWQSEFLQLLTFVTLTTVLLHKGSPESRDSDDMTAEALHRIEKRLDRLVEGALDNMDQRARQEMLEEIERGRALRYAPKG